MTLDDRPAGSEPSSFRDLIRPVLRRKWWILAAAVLATVAAYLNSSRKEDEYVGATRLYLQTQSSSSPLSTASSMPPTDRNALNQARLATARPVLEAAAERLRGAVDVNELAGAVSASSAEGSDFVNVEARSGDPVLAARMANATAVEFVEARADRLQADVNRAVSRTEAALDALPERLSREDPRYNRRIVLENRLQQLRDVQALPTNDISVTSFATPPGTPASPRPLRDALFALVLALVAALGLVYLLERFDRRVKTVEDAVDAFGAPLLAVVPHATDSAPQVDDRAALGPDFREAFRSLRTTLSLAAADAPLKTIMVTSAVPGEGKSTTVRNLAIAYREWGLRVAVVEMDLRRPSLAGLFAVEPSSGLIEVLSGERTFEEAFERVPVKVDGLQTLARIEARGAVNGNGNGADHPPAPADDGVVLLQAGTRPPNPEAILATAQAKEVLNRLAETYDVVLVDTAPLLAVSDAVPIARCVDGIVVVTRFGLTTRDEARRLMDYLRRIPGANVLGVVANDLPRGENGYGHYGYYSYAPAS